MPRGKERPIVDVKAPKSDLAPFLAARDEWDNRFGNLAAGKRNWQLMAALSLFLNVLLSGALFWLAGQSKITPYVVKVDNAGQPVAAGPAEQFGPLDPQLYRYLLSVFIYDTRAVIADPDAQKAILTHAYAYTAKDATAFLNAHFQAHNPFEHAQRETVIVHVSAILKLSDHSWQVQWTETHRPTSGVGQSEEHWQAILTTQISKPTAEEMLHLNPVGLYVTNINWTQTL